MYNFLDNNNLTHFLSLFFREKKAFAPPRSTPLLVFDLNTRVERGEAADLFYWH